MGPREPPGNLYVLYITQLQAEVIAAFCQQNDWNVTTFVCVPTKVRALLERAIKNESPIQPHTDTSVNPEIPGNDAVCDVASVSTVTVAGTQYQEMRLFDEVLKMKNKDPFNITTPVCCKVLEYFNKACISSTSARHKRKCHGAKNINKNILDVDVDTNEKLSLNEGILKTEKEMECDRDISRCHGDKVHAVSNSCSKTENTRKSVNEIMEEPEDNDSDSCEGMATAIKCDFESDAVEESVNNMDVCDTHVSVSRDKESDSEELKSSLSNIRNDITNDHQTKDLLNKMKKEHTCTNVTTPESINSRIDPQDCKSVSNKTANLSKRTHVRLNKKLPGKIKPLLERRETLTCEICGKVLASVEFYRRHLRLIHSEEAVRRKMDKEKRRGEKEVHACLLCKKQFVDKNGLRQHEMYMHSGPQPLHQCHQCGAVLKFKGSLATHMRIVHTDRRPHQCDICSNKFKSLQQLKSHQRRHDPDYIETCTVCGKTVSKGHLSSHLRRHSDVRKYECDTCLKTFYEKQDLSRHKRVHSGERPYQCPHCPYICAIKGNMTKHVKHKHEQEHLYPAALHSNHTQLTENKKNSRKNYNSSQRHAIAKEGNAKLIDNVTDNSYGNSRALNNETKEGNSFTDNRYGSSRELNNGAKEGNSINTTDTAQSSFYMLSHQANYTVPAGLVVHEAGHSKHALSKFMEVDRIHRTPTLQDEHGLLTMRHVGPVGGGEDMTMRPIGPVEDSGDMMMRPVGPVGDGGDMTIMRPVGQIEDDGAHSAPQGRDSFMPYLVSHANGGQF